MSERECDGSFKSSFRTPGFLVFSPGSEIKKNPEK